MGYLKVRGNHFQGVNLAEILLKKQEIRRNIVKNVQEENSWKNIVNTTKKENYHRANTLVFGLNTPFTALFTPYIYTIVERQVIYNKTVILQDLRNLFFHFSYWW